MMESQQDLELTLPFQPVVLHTMLTLSFIGQSTIHVNHTVAMPFLVGLPHLNAQRIMLGISLMHDYQGLVSQLAVKALLKVCRLQVCTEGTYSESAVQHGPRLLTNTQYFCPRSLTYGVAPTQVAYANSRQAAVSSIVSSPKLMPMKNYHGNHIRCSICVAHSSAVCMQYHVFLGPYHISIDAALAANTDLPLACVQLTRL